MVYPVVLGLRRLSVSFKIRLVFERLELNTDDMLGGTDPRCIHAKWMNMEPNL